MKYKLSIIIPVYNLQEYIQETLESCVQQNISSGQYEIICINDGSTDQSVEKIRKYVNAYPNIRLISQKNSGVSAARNRGLAAADGEFVWFVDGDDLIAPDCISKLCTAMAANQFDIFRFNYKICKKGIKNEAAAFGKYHLCGPESPDYFKYCNLSSVCCVIYNKKFIQIHNVGFRNGMRYSEDVLFNLQLLIRNPVLAISDWEIYYYRQRESSAMHTIHGKKFIIDMYFLVQEYHAMQLQVTREAHWHEILANKKALATRSLLLALFQRSTLRHSIKMIAVLKNSGWYPYHLKFFHFRYSGNLWQSLLLWISWGFPCRFYFYGCILLMSLLKKLRMLKKR